MGGVSEGHGEQAERPQDAGAPPDPLDRARPAALPRLQALRAFAAVAVVAYHLGTRSNEKLGLRLLGNALNAGNVGVDVFFVLSGFIIFSIHRVDIGHPAEARRYLRKRLVRVYPMYWIVASVALVIFLTGYGDAVNRNVAVIIKSAILFPQNSGVYPVLNVAWTLSFELLFYGMFAMWIAWSRRRALRYWVVWLTPTLVLWLIRVTGLGTSRGNLIDGFLFDGRNLEFLLGCGTAWLFVRRPRVPFARALMWLGVIYTVTMAALVGANASFRPLHGDPVLVFGVPAALMILGAAAWDRSGASAPPRILVRLGDASYVLYLINFNLVTTALLLLRHFGVGTPLLRIAYALATALITCAIACVIHERVEAPMLRRLRSRYVPAA